MERASIYTLHRPDTEAAMATKAFCERLKHTIERYWNERGAVVSVEVVETGFNASMRCRNYVLRSNLVNALPPKQTKAVIPRKAA